LLRGSDELASDTPGLKLRIDAKQPEIGEAIATAGDIDAAEDCVAIARDQQAAVAVEQRTQAFEIGTLAGDEIGFMRPAGAGAVAAIGALDDGVQVREIGFGGRVDVDRQFAVSSTLEVATSAMTATTASAIHCHSGTKMRTSAAVDEVWGKSAS